MGKIADFSVISDEGKVSLIATAEGLKQTELSLLMLSKFTLDINKVYSYCGEEYTLLTRVIGQLNATELVEVLLSRGASVNQIEIKAAIIYGPPEVFWMLMQHCGSEVLTGELVVNIIKSTTPCNLLYNNSFKKLLEHDIDLSEAIEYSKSCHPSYYYLSIHELLCESFERQKEKAIKCGIFSTVNMIAPGMDACLFVQRVLSFL